MKARLLFFLLLAYTVPVWGMSQKGYNQIMSAVRTRDLKTVQQMVRGGINLNSPNPNGYTPLCETVARQDYQGYELLTSQGASPYVNCMRELPPEQVQAFYANQPAPHTYYVGVMGHTKSASILANTPTWTFPTLGIGEVLLGGVAAGALFTLGDLGGSSHNKTKNKYSWDAPLNLSPAQFETTQYKSAASDFTKPVNVLGTINASSAYARGYTGKKVNRKENGTLDGIGEGAISNERVKVAVLDNGVFEKHPDLAVNVGQGANFVYGPCSEDNTEKCWKYENGVAILVGGSAPQILMSQSEWNTYVDRYKGYVYSSTNTTPDVYTKWEAVTQTETVYYTRYSKVVDGETKWFLEDNNGTAYELTCLEGGTEYCTKATWGTFGTVDMVMKNPPGEKTINHGTMVAGLIAAAEKNDNTPEGFGKMMGVAPNATLIPIKVDLTMNETLQHMADAVSLGADIINASLGANEDDATYAETAQNPGGVFDAHTTNYLAGYRSLAANNKILVIAAGNDAKTESQFFALAPLSQYFNGTTQSSDGNTYNLTNLVVNVVSVVSDSTSQDGYKLASYSNQCGVTKNYCMAAPGGEDENADSYIWSTAMAGINSSGYQYSYAGATGTSEAAPVVSGALAVIKGAFPHLTNQEVVQILFETATDLGEKGVDNVYGHGLVNLNAATNPVGLAQIVFSNTTTGQKVAASDSSVTVPSSFSNIAVAVPQNLIVLDKYNRAFVRPTKSFVKIAKRENKLENRFKSFMAGDDTVVHNDVVEMSYSERKTHHPSKMQHGSVNMLFKASERLAFKAYYSENTKTSGGRYFDRLMASPYGHMKEAWGSGLDMDISKNWSANVIGQVGKNGYVNDDDMKHMDNKKMSLWQSTLKYKGIKNTTLKLTAGLSNESGSVLGMWGKGAFKSGNSKTSFVGAGLSVNLTDNFTIDGMYYYGKTHVTNQNSLINMSGLASDSFALTATWKVDDKRLVGFQFVSPLRIKKGRAEVDLPVARDAYQDVVYRQKTSAKLKPTAREYDMGVYFTDEVADAVIFQTEMGVRLNPDHQSNAAPDWRALVGLSVDM